MFSLISHTTAGRCMPGLIPGIIDLPAGRQDIILEALSMKGGMVMDFKYLSLEREGD